MGLVYADIELVNADDLALARWNIIGEEEIKRMRVNMLVDSGAYMMAINETIQEQLDLVGPIMVKFKNRTASCNAVVLQGDNEPLLGAIPMEEMPARLPSFKIL